MIKIFNIKYIFKYFLNLKLTLLYFKYLLVFFFLFPYIQYINKKHAHEIKKKRAFTKDWFTRNIFFWLILFKKNNLINKKIKVLEIGSYEGLSSVFILHILKNSYLTIVDTFKGGVEQKSVNNFNNLRKKFNNNIKEFKKRVFVYQGKSNSFFNINKYQYDIIYIDGGHDYKQVLNDSVNSFRCLKKNGLLIWDDYFWRFYEEGKNPINAINFFLKKNKEKFSIEFLTTQLVIRKN